MSAERALVHGRDRRSELIQAGIVLLADAGSQPRVEDVTRAAGTAKGTFYTYFDSWGGFLTAVRNELLETYLEEMRARMGRLDRRNYWSALRTEIEYFVDWIASRRHLHRTVFHGAEVTADIPEELSADTAVAVFIDSGKPLGLIASDVQGAIAGRLIFRALQAAGEMATGSNRDRVIDETVRFVRASISA